MLSREIAERCAQHALDAATSQAAQSTGKRYIVQGRDSNYGPREITRENDVILAAGIARDFFAEDPLRLSAQVFDTVENRVVYEFG